MKKVFIVTGELSGDRIAAWYIKKLKEISVQHCSYEAIGGDFLRAEGVPLYKRFEELNVTGIIEIVAHLPKILNLLRTVSSYIISQHFDEVIVVDFPGFNLRLIKRLKQQNPHLKVTYLSPPQLWCWGAWRIKTVQRCCDSVVVLYPFEVEWYRKRGVSAQWQGSPVCDFLASYRSQSVHKKPLIALLPGSRHSEIMRLLPLFLKAASLVAEQYPSVRFVLPVARSIQRGCIEELVEKNNLHAVWEKVICVTDEHEKFTLLAQCCVALSKPGTVTLELALLNIPTIVAFKISWGSYFLARPLVRVNSMSLPNLLTGKTIFKEIIQYNCIPKALAIELLNIYKDFNYDYDTYQKRIAALHEVAERLTG